MKPHIEKLAETLVARKVTAKSGEDKGEVITMLCRLQWPCLDAPRAMKDDKPADGDGKQSGSKPKYSATFIVPVKADLTVLHEAAKAAAKAKWGDQAGTMVKAGRLRMPIRKQIEKTHIEGAGFGEEGFFFGASANPDYPPALRDGAANKADWRIFYPGCWVIAKVNAYPYSHPLNSGVAFGLLAVQKVADDEQLAISGGADHSADFGPIAGVPAQMPSDAGGGNGALDNW